MERYIAVDNACGWPKLTLLGDGSINMNIHNKPSHGSLDGSAVCYKSTDGAKNFSLYGITGHGSMEAGAYIEKACGTAHNGDYIVVLQNSKQKITQVLRSRDGGATYEKTGEIDTGRTHGSNHGAMPFPYGNILKLSQNTLVFHYYMNSLNDWGKGFADAVHEAHICISRDDGYTWNEDYVIAEGINECGMLFYDDNHGIAIGRIDSVYGSNAGKSMTTSGGNLIYRTRDGGKTWKYEGSLFGMGIIAVHLLQLPDGKTVLTSSFRFANKGGVIASVSNNFGQSWSDPSFLVEFPGGDGGYPSSVLLPDGTIVTAYYCHGNMYHTRYHVGVIRWTLAELIESKFIGRPAKFFIGTDEEYVANWRIL